MRLLNLLIIAMMVSICWACDNTGTDEDAGAEDAALDDAAAADTVEEEEAQDAPEEDAEPADVEEEDAGAEDAPEDVEEEEIPDDEYRIAVKEIMEERFVPGMAICIIKDGSIARCDGFGWANIEAGVRVDEHTPFLMASVSKPVTATAIMQHWDAGEFELTDDVDPLFDYTVRNPGFEEPIEYRHVLTHTSSIVYTRFSHDQYYTDTDPEISLEELFYNYFSPDGIWYVEGANYTEYAPGTYWNYSNYVFALIGHMVELIEGGDFVDYCKANIFEPLGMDNTSFWLEDFPDRDRIAMPYVYQLSDRSYHEIGHYSFTEFPAGGLRSSAYDMARFLIAFINGGELDGNRILSEDAIEQMKTIQFPDVDRYQGLGWGVVQSGGQTQLSHAGQLGGVGTLVTANLDAQTGYTMLMNCAYDSDVVSMVLEEISTQILVL